MSEAPVPELAQAPPDDAASAFEAMRGELALLTAATRGFASRQEEIASRDYADDLARLVALQERICGAIRTLAERPGVALTPETFAARLVDAAATSRRDDHAMLTRASQQLDGMIGRIRERQAQRDALVWAFLSGMITVLILIALAQLLS
jgi:hypothetical protein